MSIYKVFGQVGEEIAYRYCGGWSDESAAWMEAELRAELPDGDFKMWREEVLPESFLGHGLPELNECIGTESGFPSGFDDSVAIP